MGHLKHTLKLTPQLFQNGPIPTIMTDSESDQNGLHLKKRKEEKKNTRENQHAKKKKKTFNNAGKAWKSLPNAKKPFHLL